MLRGGAFKPRTSPYDFQGLGVKGLRYLAEARERTGLPVVTEVLSWEEVPLVGALRRHAADRCPEHAELLPAPGRGHGAACRCCSSAAQGPRSRSG